MEWIMMSPNANVMWLSGLDHQGRRGSWIHKCFHLLNHPSMIGHYDSIMIMCRGGGLLMMILVGK
jgi:hypothetical protein